MNVFYDSLKEIAMRGLEKQKINDGDYFGDDGILICGKCNEAKQEIKTLHSVSDNEDISFKCVRMCRCERSLEEKRIMTEREEKKKENIANLKRQSLMDTKYENATFDSFQQTVYNQNNLKLCRRYVQRFREMYEKGQGLLFWGGVGTGKSYTAACITNALIQQEISVIMTSFVKILDSIQANMNAEDELLYKIAKAELVVFDDLGAERRTEYSLEKTYNFLDTRYRTGKPMIITTNLTIAEMKDELDVKYERLYDRIFEVCYPIQFTGHSFRKKNASDRIKEMEKILGE